MKVQVSQKVFSVASVGSAMMSGKMGLMLILIFNILEASSSGEFLNVSLLH